LAKAPGEIKTLRMRGLNRVLQKRNESKEQSSTRAAAIFKTPFRRGEIKMLEMDNEFTVLMLVLEEVEYS